MKNLLKLFSVLMVLIGSFAFGQTLDFPKDEQPTKIFGKEHLENEWNLESAEKNVPYYFNFFAENNNDKVVKFEKTDNGLIIEPIESNSGEMIFQFYKDGKVIKSSKINSRGPNIIDLGIEFFYSKPQLIYSKTLSNKKKIWPVLVAVGLCCVKVKYTYTSGNPPKHTTTVEFNCTCLNSKMSSGVPIIVDGKEIYVDYMTITTVNEVRSNGIGLIVSK